MTKSKNCVRRVDAGVVKVGFESLELGKIWLEVEMFSQQRITVGMCFLFKWSKLVNMGL